MVRYLQAQGWPIPPTAAQALCPFHRPQTPTED